MAFRDKDRDVIINFSWLGGREKVNGIAPKRVGENYYTHRYR
jgi:hypothetical protein